MAKKSPYVSVQKANVHHFVCMRMAMEDSSIYKREQKMAYYYSDCRKLRSMVMGMESDSIGFLLSFM